MSLRVVAYTRVSTEEQTKGFSLEDQLDQVIRVCENRNWDFVDVYSDPGISGSTMERPGLQTLLAESAEKKFDLVLVVNLDRISRELSDIWPIIRRLRDNNVGVATTTIPDLSSITKEFYLAFGGPAGQAQWYLENLKELQKGGITKAKGKGMHLGRVPNGFYINDDGRLQPGELGRRALETLAGEPNIALSDLVGDLGLKDVNQAFRIKKACQRYNQQIERLRTA